MKYQELKVGGYYKVVSSEEGRKYTQEVPVGTVFKLGRPIANKDKTHYVVMFKPICVKCGTFSTVAAEWNFYSNEVFEHLIPEEIAKYTGE